MIPPRFCKWTEHDTAFEYSGDYAIPKFTRLAPIAFSLAKRSGSSGIASPELDFYFEVEGEDALGLAVFRQLLH
jgi:hypothetical protein